MSVLSGEGVERLFPKMNSGAEQTHSRKHMLRELTDLGAFKKVQAASWPVSRGEPRLGLRKVPAESRVVPLRTPRTVDQRSSWRGAGSGSPADSQLRRPGRPSCQALSGALGTRSEDLNVHVDVPS